MSLQIGPFPVGSAGHIIFALIYWSLAIVVSILLRKQSKKVIYIIIACLAVIFVPFEVYMQISRIVHNWGNPSWWLYYPVCALFAPALVFSLFKNKYIKNMGLSFLAIGGIFGGFMYMTNPGGGIIDNSLFHWHTIYGTSYHFSMLTLGLTILTSNYYKLTLKGTLYYMAFMFTPILLGLILNPIYNVNILFLDNPTGAPILNDIYLWCKPVYTTLVAFGQGVAWYLLGLGASTIVDKCIEKHKQKKGLALS